jgi:hypothetical protein
MFEVRCGSINTMIQFERELIAKGYRRVDGVDAGDLKEFEYLWIMNRASPYASEPTVQVTFQGSSSGPKGDA